VTSFGRIASLVLSCGILADALSIREALLAQQSGVVFESNWDTAVGTSTAAVTDGGRWPNYWEFNGGTYVQLLSVVSDGVNGHHALRVEQRGPRFAANLQIDDFLPPSSDYYVRYYMKNEDTSSSGDHIVTGDTWQYANLTFMRKYGSPTGWNFVISAYGCGYIYPIGHWGPAQKLANGQWYRFEYHVDFIDRTHMQVHPRVYDAAGTLILSDADFRQSDYGSTTWNGRSDWTLASYYGAGHSLCVDPKWVNDFALGNNGQYAALDTRRAWYFSAVEIRTDRWPGPVAGGGSTGTVPEATNLAARYPGDVNIESDPEVLFVERFEEPTLQDLFTRWTDVLHGSAMAFTADVPQGSPGGHSLDIRWIGGGVNDGGHLYKQIMPGIDDALYVRYYIQYPPNGRYDHAGVWMGGHNPPLMWPNPQAGMKPAGNDRFIAAAEQTTSTAGIDHYDYWTDMHASAGGQYWGNVLLNNPTVRVTPGQWACVEHMVKLNDPASSNGEHAIWLDGVKVSHLGPGFPVGYWSEGTFRRDPAGSPFEGFRWRTRPTLNLNWIWLLNYAPNNPEGSSGSVKFDHLVVAKSYIGCLATSGSAGSLSPIRSRQ